MCAASAIWQPNPTAANHSNTERIHRADIEWAYGLDGAHPTPAAHQIDLSTIDGMASRIGHPSPPGESDEPIAYDHRKAESGEGMWPTGPFRYVRRRRAAKSPQPVATASIRRRVARYSTGEVPLRRTRWQRFVSGIRQVFRV